MPDLTVQEAIEARRSIRRYTDEQIPRETIEELLRLANLAPTSSNLQPARVVVVTDYDEKQKLMANADGQKQVGAAAAVFVITTDMKDVLANLDEVVHPGMSPERRQSTKENLLEHFSTYSESDLNWWGKAQGYIFLGFLLLAAQSKGYSTSAMLGFDPVKVRAQFGLADHVQIPAIVAMGVGAEEGFSHHRHPVERFARII